MIKAKYENTLQAVVNLDFKFDAPVYRLAGCYPLAEDYFDWSDPRTIDLKINTANLMGAPGCPYCGNITAFAVCGCGKLLCINGPGEAVCPWCEETVIFRPGTKDDDAGFDVGRGRG